MLDRFAPGHERQYGFSLTGEAVELVNLRITAMRPDLPVPPVADAHEDLPSESRKVWFEPHEPVDCPIYRRASLRPGTELEGPAVIEEPDSTTLVFPTDRLLVDESGVLVITVGGQR